MVGEEGIRGRGSGVGDPGAGNGGRATKDHREVPGGRYPTGADLMAAASSLLPLLPPSPPPPHTDLAKYLSPDRSGLKAKIHVPRLNGGRMGVLATRSPHRPSPIGLSTARVVGVEVREGVRRWGRG